MKRFLILSATVLLLALGVLLMVPVWSDGAASDSAPSPDLPAASAPPSAAQAQAPAQAPAASRTAESEGRAALEADIAAEGRAEDDPDLWIVEIRDPEGAPVSGTVAVWSESRLLHTDRTGHGRVEFAPGEAEREVFFTTFGRPLHRAVFPGAVGRYVMTVPTNAVLSGRILDFDAADMSPMFPTLQADRPLHPEWSTPPQVAEALGRRWHLSGSFPCQVSGEGEFAFFGLPEDWSGSLGFGAWRVAATTAGSIQDDGRTLHLERATQGLEVRLAPRFAITGLVLNQDDQPVPGLALVCRAERGTDVVTRPLQFSTKEDGRFRLRLWVPSAAELVRLTVRLAADPTSPPLFDAEAEGIPADGNLGVLRIEAAGELRFRLLTPNGSPVEGGKATAGGAAAGPTGADGRASLSPLLASAETLRAVAADFAPTEMLIPRPLPAELDVRLLPANRLEVYLPQVPDEVRRNLGLSLLAEEAILLPASESKDHLTEHTPHPKPWMSTLDEQGAIRGFVSFLEMQDPLVLRALQPGVDFELALVGSFGRAEFCRVRVPGLGPRETRRVDLALDGSLRSFRARVTDPAGEPVAGAHLQLSNQMLGKTDVKGELLCFTVEEETKTLVIFQTGFASLYVKDFLAPADGSTLDFTLQPARQVTVSVVNEDGQPLTECRVKYELGGFTTSTQPLSGGRFLINGLGNEPIRIEAIHGGRSVWIDHDPAIPDATVVFPLHSGGRVAVRLASSTGFPTEARYSAHLSPEAGGEPLGIYLQALLPEGFDFAAVPPGRYDFTITYFPSSQEQARGETMRQVLGPVPVEVVEGETAELEVNVSGLVN